MSIQDNLELRIQLDQEIIKSSTKNIKLIDGSYMNVCRIGDGVPIIFVPTIDELNFLYIPQVNCLREQYQCILYEPRLSTIVRISLEDRTRELLLLADTLSIKNAHIIAWSDAGSVAYVLAKTRPEICRSIAFLGLADTYRFPQPLHSIAKVLDKLPLAYFIPGKIIAFMLSLFLGGDRIPPSFVRKRAQQIHSLTKLFKYSILPCMLDHRSIYGEVHTPSLVACGDRDALVSVGQARRMAYLVPNAGEAAIIPNGEHMLTYANPIEVNLLLQAFYKRIE
jgi:pimeloyl-ACP methyl ester carboxylesterase